MNSSALVQNSNALLPISVQQASVTIAHSNKSLRPYRKPRRAKSANYVN